MKIPRLAAAAATLAPGLAFAQGDRGVPRRSRPVRPRALRVARRRGRRIGSSSPCPRRTPTTCSAPSSCAIRRAASSACAPTRPTARPRPFAARASRTARRATCRRCWPRSSALPSPSPRPRAQPRGSCWGSARATSSTARRCVATPTALILNEGPHKGGRPGAGRQRRRSRPISRACSRRRAASPSTPTRRAASSSTWRATYRARGRPLLSHRGSGLEELLAPPSRRGPAAGLGDGRERLRPALGRRRADLEHRRAGRLCARSPHPAPLRPARSAGPRWGTA